MIYKWVIWVNIVYIFKSSKSLYVPHAQSTLELFMLFPVSEFDCVSWKLFYANTFIIDAYIVAILNFGYQSLILF